MSFEQVESLKKQYTDKYVEVDSAVAELRRFQGLTGVVKTVNMGGRALVQFDHPVDISWYDIEPSYLKVVDKPVGNGAGSGSRWCRHRHACCPRNGQTPLQNRTGPPAGYRGSQSRSTGC